MKPWQINFEGHVWPETSLTAAEAVDVARLTGGSYEAISPLAGPESLVAIIATLCATRLGEDLNAAIERVQAMPLVDLLGCVEALAIPSVSAVPAA